MTDGQSLLDLLRALGVGTTDAKNTERKPRLAFVQFFLEEEPNSYVVTMFWGCSLAVEPRFYIESFQEGRVHPNNHLDRDEPIELRITRLVHDAHSTSTDSAKNLVLAYCCRLLQQGFDLGAGDRTGGPGGS